MQSICQLDFRSNPAVMLIDAARVAQIMRDPRIPDATTRPYSNRTDQSGVDETGIACARFAQSEALWVAGSSDQHRINRPGIKTHGERLTSIFGVTLQFDRRMHPFTIVFDLDGTLVDTAPDLVATLNVVLAREGLQPVAYADGRLMVGGGVRLMVERGIKASGRQLPAAEVNRLERDFIAHYADHIAVHSRPFDGVEAALDQLAASGYGLAVCTNKLESLSVRLLDALKLSSRFRAICGADTFGVSKPNPAILSGTIERAGGDKTRAIMIGDSLTDIATARAAGIPVLAVDFGYTDIPVAELKPDRVVSAFSELPEVISQLLSTG